MDRNKFDPQLHLLRSAARGIEDGRVKFEATQARFNLFTAMQADNKNEALGWLNALEVALRTGGLEPEVADPAYEAVRIIREGL